RVGRREAAGSLSRGADQPPGAPARPDPLLGRSPHPARAERTAGLAPEVLVQAVVLGEERRPKLQDRLGSGLTPGFLRPLHTPVEEFHGGLHVAARPRQALLPIARV